MIPVFGWALSFAFSASLSVPFYFLWNHLIPRYAPLVPPPYNALPFWDCVWIFMLLPIIGHAIATLTPKIISIEQKNENK